MGSVAPGGLRDWPATEPNQNNQFKQSNQLNQFKLCPAGELGSACAGGDPAPTEDAADPEPTENTAERKPTDYAADSKHTDYAADPEPKAADPPAPRIPFRASRIVHPTSAGSTHKSHVYILNPKH